MVFYLRTKRITTSGEATIEVHKKWVLPGYSVRPID